MESKYQNISYQETIYQETICTSRIYVETQHLKDQLSSTHFFLIRHLDKNWKSICSLSQVSS